MILAATLVASPVQALASGSPSPKTRLRLAEASSILCRTSTRDGVWLRPQGKGLTQYPRVARMSDRWSLDTRPKRSGHYKVRTLQKEGSLFDALGTCDC